MATQQTTTAGRLLVAPSVILLFLWTIVPLVMTLYFSTLHYNLLDPDNVSFIGLQNFAYFLTDPIFIGALINTLVLVVSVLIISVVRRHSGRAADGSADLRPGHRSRDGDRAVLHHADRQRAGVEEPADEPGLGPLRMDLPIRSDCPSVDWFTNWPMLVGRHHRRLAMAAVREPDPADRAAIARRGAEGSRRARRRRADLLSSSISCCRIWRARSPSSC